MPRRVPWLTVDGGVIYQLSASDLVIDGCVGVVLGLAGEQLGLAFCGSLDAYIAFRRIGLLGPTMPHDVGRAILVTLDLLAELPPGMQDMVGSVGLRVADYAILQIAIGEDAIGPVPHRRGARVADRLQRGARRVAGARGQARRPQDRDPGADADRHGAGSDLVRG